MHHVQHGGPIDIGTDCEHEFGTPMQPSRGAKRRIDAKDDESVKKRFHVFAACVRVSTLGVHLDDNPMKPGGCTAR
jgi:hypothetical protein